MSSLFRQGLFSLHSGETSKWKIDCDELSYPDWATLTEIALEILPPFGEVVGVPRGGLMLAQCLSDYVTDGPLLICDDVLSTGGSMEQMRGNKDAIGLVIFSRGKCPDWIFPLFQFYQGKE